MKWVGHAAQVRELDRRVIEDLGVPGIALMEVAARGVARSVLAHHRSAAEAGTVVVCGAGNNGGDGWAIARWLHQASIPATVWAVRDPTTEDARCMANAARRLGIAEVDGPQGAGLLIDAVFGTGLARPVQGDLAKVLQRMADHGAPVVAVDVPSGLHADQGIALGVCVRAVRTVTLGRLKLGLFGAQADLCGEVELVDIGLGAGDRGDPPAAWIPEARDLAPHWPLRAVSDHKGRTGRLLVVAGSTAMAGAAVLACRGALAAGAGLVTLAAPRGALGRLAALPPEVMVLPTGEGDRLEALPGVAPYDAVAAGPGLGGGAPLPEALTEALARLWGQGEIAAVFDADALPATGSPGPGPRVLTPHPGEAGRLLACSAAAVQADRFAAVGALADRGVALLKGPHTLVAHGAAPLSINPTGHPVLATGGSGDVLTGVIGGLLARGVPAFDAARLGAWVHGTAGEILAERGVEGWHASHVADAIPGAVQRLLGAA